MPKKSTLSGYIYIIASAVIFGCMPLMTKLIYAEGINSMSLVFLRNTISLPMLALIAIPFGGRFAIDKASILPTALIGALGCAITPFLLFLSYSYIPSGTSTVLHFIYPVAVVVLEIVFLRKKVMPVRILSLVLCVLGIALFYIPSGGINFTGAILALSSGVTYALYILFLGLFKKKDISGFVFSFFTSAFAAVIMLLFCLMSGGLTLPSSTKGWILCVIFAFIINVGAVVLFQRGTFLIGGERASILSTLEPITSVIIGISVLGDDFFVSIIIGSLLVVASSVLIAVSDMRSVNE